MLEEILGSGSAQCEAVVGERHAGILRRRLSEELPGIMGPEILPEGATFHVLLLRFVG
jgi:hypothetical protein